MSFYSNEEIGIAAIACSVPDNEVTVDSFVPAFGEKNVRRFAISTGINAMYKALPDQTAGDLAYAAAENLFDHYTIDRRRIGALLFVTQSPDYRRPATACVLQYRLRLSEDCAAMDIGLGCSGFIYGLQTAMGIMQQSDMEYCLLLMGETASKVVHPLDRSVAMMYGDAGAAVLLERREGERISALLKSDGSRFRSIILPAGGFRDMDPPRETFLCNDGIERSLYDVHMDGASVFSFSITDVPESIQEFLEHTGTNAENYDLFLFHQANQFILRQLAKKFRLPQGKVPISLDQYGNTGGVSIPLTLCANWGGRDDGRKKVLMVGFGIGLSWGIMDASVDTAAVFPVVRTDDWFREGRITAELFG